MKTKLKTLLLFIPLLLIIHNSAAQNEWDKNQKQILEAIASLSASTAPKGEGVKAYGKILSNDFTRWTLGSEKTNNKQQWLKSIDEWFNEGWRVSDRKTLQLDIKVRGQMAFTRRVVKETYLGPKNEQSTSKAALAEVWIKNKKGWLLMRVDVIPLKS